MNLIRAILLISFTLISLKTVAQTEYKNSVSTDVLSHLRGNKSLNFNYIRNFNKLYAGLEMDYVYDIATDFRKLSELKTNFGVGIELGGVLWSNEYIELNSGLNFKFGKFDIYQIDKSLDKDNNSDYFEFRKTYNKNTILGLLKLGTKRTKRLLINGVVGLGYAFIQNIAVIEIKAIERPALNRLLFDWGKLMEHNIHRNQEFRNNNGAIQLGIEIGYRF